jgi:hypothetical protein
LSLALVVAAAVAGTSTFARAAAQTPALLTMSKDGAYGKDPAHESVGLIGYDTKKGQYVAMGGNTLPGGDSGIGTAKASPSATTMTFLNAYPADPTREKSAYTFGASSVTWSDAWTEKGKAMTGHGSCTKQ